MGFRHTVTAFVLAVSGCAASAQAQDARRSTLEVVRGRGAVVCGVNPGSPGFSVVDSAGMWRGLNADTCRAISAAIFGSPDRTRFVPLSAQARFAALQSGEVDVLTWQTTHTLSRDTAIGLSLAAVNFYDGQAFLVRRSSGVASARELNGATICVEPGTTTELTVTDWFRAAGLLFTPVVLETVAQNVEAYRSGRCDVWTSDVSQLSAARAGALGDPAGHVILPERISKEPLGPVVRQGDERWVKIVRWTVLALIEAEELGVTAAQAETVARGADPAVRRLLGSAGGLGKGLGLDDRWALDVVRAVGNYGEIYERHVGAGSAIRLPRGLNDLWTRGGLLYSPPFR